MRAAAFDLIDRCAMCGYAVRLQGCSGVDDCKYCEQSSFEGSSMCRGCRTVWVAPTPLHGASATPAEVVSALAHEVGHVIDEPRQVEPAKGTPEWHVRRVEREEEAWRIAAEILGSDPAWPELEETFDAVRKHRVGRYRDERDRALGF